MTDRPKSRPASDVAQWHRLSGLPDNVTDEGEVVSVPEGRRQQLEKDALRADIQRLCGPDAAPQVLGLARLAASYLLAGDVETARRYVNRATDWRPGEGSSVP